MTKESKELIDVLEEHTGNTPEADTIPIPPKMRAWLMNQPEYKEGCRNDVEERE